MGTNKREWAKGVNTISPMLSSSEHGNIGHESPSAYMRIVPRSMLRYGFSDVLSVRARRKQPRPAHMRQSRDTPEIAACDYCHVMDKYYNLSARALCEVIVLLFVCLYMQWQRAHSLIGFVCYTRIWTKSIWACAARLSSSGPHQCS